MYSENSLLHYLLLLVVRKNYLIKNRPYGVFDNVFCEDDPDAAPTTVRP